MALKGSSERSRRIDSRDALAAFLDAHSAAAASGWIRAYARARATAGVGSLLSDERFQAAMDKANWEAYPVALTVTGQTIEGVLAAHAEDRLTLLHGITAAVIAAFDRHPVPSSLGASAWNSARGEIVRWLGAIGRRPPQPVQEIVATFAGPLLALMPMDDRLGGDDLLLLSPLMHESLVRIREQFERTADCAGLVRSLTID